MYLKIGHRRISDLFLILFVSYWLGGCSGQVEFNGEALEGGESVTEIEVSDEEGFLPVVSSEGDFDSEEDLVDQGRDVDVDCPPHQNRLNEIPHDKNRYVRQAVIVDWGYDFYNGDFTTITVEIQDLAGHLITDDFETEIRFEPHSGSAITGVVCGHGDSRYGVPYQPEVVMVHGGVATIRVEHDKTFNVGVRSMSPATPFWGVNTTYTEVFDH